MSVRPITPHECAECVAGRHGTCLKRALLPEPDTFGGETDADCPCLCRHSPGWLA